LTSVWATRRVLVTGATGMVGSWLVKRLLHEGADVTALVLDGDPQSELYRGGDLARIAVVNGALEDIGALERAVTQRDADTVFHLGAQALVGVGDRSPLATFETNIRGTYNLLEVCRRHRDLVRRVVVASSDKAYGEQPRLPYVEEMSLAGRRPYEVSKSCTDLIAQSYHSTYGLPIGIVRCGNIFGGGDLNWSRLIPGTIRAFLRQERPVIRSDGSYVRDYFYVEDSVSAYLRVAEGLADPANHGEAFNFGPEDPRTVLDVVAVIQKLMDCAHLAPDIRATATGEIRSQYLSIEKARRILQWAPEFSLEAGLRNTIAWYRAFAGTAAGGV
jgi:CDP-glucose 4,6-dehydratase